MESDNSPVRSEKQEEEEEMKANEEELRENLGRNLDMKDPSKKKMASLLP